MSIQEYFTFDSDYDDLTIDCLMIRPDEEPKAVLQMAHGMSEYKERYIPLMEYLANRGYVCCMNDHRGHGKSVKDFKDLGYFYSGGGNALVEDMHKLTDILQERYPGLPFYLFGHSMGSLAVRVYAKRYDDDINGLIVCGCPSENSAIGVAEALVDMMIKIKGERYLSKLCSSLFVGMFNKNFKKEGSDFAWLSVNRDNVSKYEEDPYCGFNFTLNGYKALIYLMKETYSKDNWHLHDPSPVIFISGENDPCMTNRKMLMKAVGLMDQVGYRDVSYNMFEGMRHEILQEDARENVFDYIDGTLGGWMPSDEVTDEEDLTEEEAYGLPD